jgi:hypothetical protein
MHLLKEKLKNFWVFWAKYDKPVSVDTPKATILIVADDLITINDASLQKSVRTAIPNTLSESTLLH